MDTFNSRIKTLVTQLGYSNSSKFDEFIEVSASQTQCVTGPKKAVPRISYVQKIKAAFPKVNTNWLLVGEGDMFTNVEELTNLRNKVEQLELDNLNLQTKLDALLHAMVQFSSK